MASLKECIDFEAKKPQKTIRLVLFGNFYRAHDHSAWLFTKFIKDSFKVLRKFSKAENRDVLYVGFPKDRLAENTGGHAIEQTELGFDLKLRDDEVFNEADYNEWLKTVPTTDGGRSDFAALPLAGIDAEREVIRRLREIHLETMTPLQCIVFLSELVNLLIQK